MSQFFSLEGILALILGGLYGSIFGAIPGLTATLAIALFIPFAFFLDPIIALPAIIAISSVAIYAGDVGSAIARIPGTPASAAYTEELYQISKRKSPIFGLGLSAMGSAIGGIIGSIILIISATAIASIAKQFSSFEYFWIAVLGLCAGIFASSGSYVKSFISLLLGLLLATIGVDPTLGHARFTFGNPNLLSGINYIVAMIGLFGFSEVLEAIYRQQFSTFQSQELSAASSLFFIKPLHFIKRKWSLVLRSSLLGTFIGFLPGAGADIGSWVSSSLQKIQNKRTSNGEKEGEEESIVLAGVSSNNAAVSSAWIPALSLGLPGDTVTAMVLGVFLMKGISPGPLLFEQQPELIQSLFFTFIIANVFLLPFFGYLAARISSTLVKLSPKILFTSIACICIVGAYAINNNPIDIFLMMLMGVVAFVLKRGGFPLAQVVLGMVLGPILESNFMVSAIKSKWDLMSFFNRPLAIIFMIATLLIIFFGVRYSKKLKKQDF